MWFTYYSWLIGIICALTMCYSYWKYRDPFHPLIIVMPMFAFIYWYMPLRQIASREVYYFINDTQGAFVQFVALWVLVAFIFGCELGTRRKVISTGTYVEYDPAILRKGAYILGSLGMLAWLYMLRTTGGLAVAYGESAGMVWNDLGYVRDSVYLLLVAIFLLLSPVLYRPRSIIWWASIGVFATPWALQAVLGARRGPTFVLLVSIGVSWFMVRRRRPPIVLTLVAGAAVGMLMLFLVSNRGKIYVGSDENLDSSKIGKLTDATSANEFIFSAGCIISSDRNFEFYWGRRIIAEILVRPIPHQLWEDKYEDFGVPQLVLNGGANKGNVTATMGYKVVPGAADAMVADLWVEFWWGAIPFSALWGFIYGYGWKRANISGDFWITQYVILVVLSVYLVTQGLEAVTFRIVILSVPTYFIWKRASYLAEPVDEEAELVYA